MSDRTPNIGQSVPSREGTALLRGAGQFTGDIALPDALVLHILRSPVAASRLSIGDLSGARAMPGIAAIHTGADVAELGRLPINPVLPLDRMPDFPVLAHDRIDAVGQPVAAILADTADQALDAADLIPLDHEDSPAAEARPLAERRWRAGDPDAAFAAACHVVSVQITHPVLAPSPLEPRSIAVRYAPGTESVTIWHSTQTPHRTRSALAEILDLSPDRLRVIAPDVGGAFGMKGSIYPEEVLAVWAAFRHQRNVTWCATRSEEFLSATHGRGLTSRGELAVSDTGRFLGLKAEIEAPLGHWVPNSGLIPAWNAARVLPCAYDIADLDVVTTARLTAQPPRGIYRGAGRPEANALMERLVDEAARVTGIDPLELRRRNLLARDRLPHRTGTGNLLDSGDYPAAVQDLLDSGTANEMRAWRDARRADGDLAGVGVAFYVEPSGEGWESARVTLHEDRAAIDSGSSAQGQWRRTAFAQIAADALDLPVSAITVRYGDTGTCPEGIGALASRSTAIGGSAVQEACAKALALRAKGAPYPITVDTRYEAEGQAWGFGLCLAALTVDRDTGRITPHRISVLDDTGTVINPALVRGQIFGGLAQGLGEALLEEVHFDADGQLLTGSFMDYAMPRATDLPPIDLQSRQSASPMNLLGAKGVGEAGTIAAPAALLNAAIDALRPVGVTDLTMPLTPCKVWQAMQTAGTGQTS